MDLTFSALSLLLLAPLFLLVSILVKCSSRGPAFYSQYRVGQSGRLFKAWKFRSMVADADRVGPGITCSGDSRVTKIGAFLRRLKIDELPQLWNVLRGEMSLVGPRPEIPTYVQGYSPQQRMVLLARPGITDLASLTYRHEEELLRCAPSPEQFYRDVVLPHKLALNLQYIEKMSLSYDVWLILQTLKVLFLSSLTTRKEWNVQEHVPDLVESGDSRGIAS